MQPVSEELTLTIEGAVHCDYLSLQEALELVQQDAAKGRVWVYLQIFDMVTKRGGAHWVKVTGQEHMQKEMERLRATSAQ